MIPGGSRPRPTPPTTRCTKKTRRTVAPFSSAPSARRCSHYEERCLDDLHAFLKEQGDWVELGSADEQKEPKDGTVEAWGRSTSNPVGGWYGLKKGLRGRFGMYIPPLMEALGRAELEHNPRNNRMRAI